MADRVSRRTAILALLLSMVMLLAGACTAGPENGPDSLLAGFVRRCGVQFCLDGQPFYFGGSNTYDMFTFGAWSDDVEERSIDKAAIDTHFARLRSDNVAVLRLWMFSHESWHGFEPAKGVYNETQFKLFDYIVASAGRHGIRLLPVLENYWEEYGGIDQRLRWEGLPGGPEGRSAFFDPNRCPGCFAQYKAYARFALDRVNTFTGIAYRDDPTIFAWELMNEPRYRYEPAPDDAESRTMLRAWVDEMAGYLKSLDHNHMVGVGVEGLESGHDFACAEHNPFVSVHRSPYIDYASAHVYPTDKGLTMTLEDAKAFFRKMVDASRKAIGKPFYLTEFNVSESDRQRWWTEIFGELERGDANGIGFWWYQNRNLDAGVGVEAGAPELAVFRDLASRQAAKHALSAPPQPTMPLQGCG
jgi:hypothetical protein